MRIKLSVFRLICLVTWAGCTGDPPETDPVDSPGVVPNPDGGTGGTGGTGLDGSQAPTADGGGMLPGDAGIADAQRPTPQSDAALEAGSPPQGDAGPQGACPSKYATASLMRLEMSWPGTVGYVGGSGMLHAWAKTTFTSTASGTMIEAAPCGVDLPVVTATALLDGAKIANDMPVSAFDQPSMPRYPGRAAWQGSELVLDLGASVIGAKLSDPLGTWPFREALMLVDHDGDGKPGVTAIPRKDPPFLLPPGDILLISKLDAVYTASRISARVRAPSEGCSGPVEGSVEPLGFDYTLVGCHILDGGECGASEVNLLSNFSPAFTLGSGGTWRSVPIAENAQCADVRKALPAE